jgi:hypothetical protein
VNKIKEIERISKKKMKISFNLTMFKFCEQNKGDGENQRRTNKLLRKSFVFLLCSKLSIRNKMPLRHGPWIFPWSHPSKKRGTMRVVIGHGPMVLV